jgi:hypothetical protein
VASRHIHRGFPGRTVWRETADTPRQNRTAIGSTAPKTFTEGRTMIRGVIRMLGDRDEGEENCQFD